LPDTPNGDGYAHNFNARMDRMNDFLQSMTESFLEHHRVAMEEIKAMREANREQHTLTMDEMREQHTQTMDEIRELLTLQREHRVDIMALFEFNKDAQKRLTDLEPKGKEGGG
jgi:hypothetical protein